MGCSLSSPCFFSLFSFLEHDLSLLSCPLSSKRDYCSSLFLPLFFYHVYQWGSFHTADLLTVFFEQSQRPFSPTAIHFIYCLSHIPLLSFSPLLSLLSLIINSPLLSLNVQRSQLGEEKKITALLWVFFSWVEHPAPTHTPNWETSVFQRRSLGGPWRRWWQFSGFPSKPRAKKPIPSVSASKWNGKHLEAKGFFPPISVCLSALWSERCLKNHPCFGPSENVTVNFFIPVTQTSSNAWECSRVHICTHIYCNDFWLLISFFPLFVESLICTSIQRWPESWLTRTWETAATAIKYPQKDMMAYSNRGKNPHFPLIFLSFPCSLSSESTVKWVLLQYPSQAPF